MQTATTLSEQDQALRAGRFTSTRVVQLVKGNALGVYLDMMGMAPPRKDNVRMAWGRRLESVIIDAAAEEKGWRSVVKHPGTIVSRANPLFATSVDAIADDEIAVEAKNRGGERAREYECNEPLEDEIVQDTWHQGVLGLPQGAVAVLLGGNNLKVFPVPFNADIFGGLAEMCLRFKRDHLDTGKPPPVDASAAAGDYLRVAFPKETGPVLAADDALAALAKEVASLRKAEKAATTAKVLAENRLKEAIGSAVGVEGPGLKVTWKTQKGSTYTVVREPGRVLRVKVAGIEEEG